MQDRRLAALAQNRTAQVSPDGSYLAFMSAAPLTGYDNEVQGDATQCGRSGVRTCYEVFEYDAAHPEAHLRLLQPQRRAAPRCFQPQPDRSLGLGSLPSPSPATSAPTPAGCSSKARRPHSRRPNGRIQDVYECEPDGVGGCRRPGGCLLADLNRPRRHRLDLPRRQRLRRGRLLHHPRAAPARRQKRTARPLRCPRRRRLPRRTGAALPGRRLQGAILDRTRAAEPCQLDLRRPAEPARALQARLGQAPWPLPQEAAQKEAPPPQEEAPPQAPVRRRPSRGGAR